MTASARTRIRQALDAAARRKAERDDAREQALLLEEGLCAHCRGPIPDERRRHGSTRYCTRLCGKRSTYAADVERVQRRKEVTH